MLCPSFHFLSKQVRSLVSLITVVGLLFATSASIYAIDSVRSSPLSQSPLFPPDNWWNLDISNWPVDPNSSSYIAFINNGGTRRLHPDFGGNAGTTQDPNAIYGFPYAVVSNVTNADLRAVQFAYAGESDGLITLEILASRSIRSRRRRSHNLTGSRVAIQGTSTGAAAKIAIC
jgi:hypothetical protein